MLHSISWQQYFTVILLGTAAWYAYIYLRFYKPKSKEQPVMPPVAKHEVIGAIKPDADTGLHEADELVFAEATPDDVSEQTLTRGPGDDLLDEARLLIEVYADNKNKTEFLSFLQLLISKYQVHADEIDLSDVITALKASAHQLPFRLKDSEWPTNF